MRQTVYTRVIAILCLLAVSSLADAQNLETVAEKAQQFESKIRPILYERCFGCHAEKLQRGGLRLDSRSFMTKGGDSGSAVAIGEPDKSLLIKAIRYDTPLKMPPSGKLSEAEVSELTRWVKAGAFFPEANAAKPNQPQSKKTDLASAFVVKTKFWSFQPVRKPAIPTLKRTAKVANPIDSFLLSELEKQGLSPAPPADRRTLIRRASFDLTGLPPTPDEIDDFLKDRAPNAWQKAIDRLLASQRYGEKWGRRWLDVVRYADSLDARGLGSEGDISEAWRYRDWVIDAFNRDMPYDQFVMNQIAGDLLPADGSGKSRNVKRGGVSLASTGEVSTSGIVATGLLAIGNWGNGDADKEKILTDIADDQLDIVSRGFMGLTVACARCHDHKFDPISAKDYYGLAGVFFSTHILPKLGAKGAGETILRVPLETKSEKAAREAYALKLAGLEKNLEAARTQILTAHAKKRLPETSKYLLAAWDYSHPMDSSAPRLSFAEFAKAAGLQEYALRQWADFSGFGEFRPLANRMNDVGGVAGVTSYQNGTDTPNATINSTNESRKISTLTLPAKSVSVHPGPTSGVALSWVSPISGEVEVRGKVADADPNCGDGIAWSIGRRRTSGYAELASGEFANGGAQNFAEGKQGANLKSILLKAGERLELQILPKGDYFCDTTVIDFDIREKAGAKVWNVTNDLLKAGAEKGAPWSDSYGNSAVWNFLDIGGNSSSVKNGSAKLVFELWKRLSSELDSLPEDQRRSKMASLASAFQREFQATDSASPFWISRQEDETALSEPAKIELKTLRGEIESFKKSPPPPLPFANAAQEGGVPESPHAGTHDVKVHIRGRYDRLGELVPRRFPLVIAGENQPPISEGSGRLELARWIASPMHPLTARVIVNRVWQGHFGRGIVGTPSNFGFLGERPTNPALLDWLASEFTAEAKGELGDVKNQPSDKFACNWSIKRLHRLIILSNAYQRSSELSPVARVKDADNRLFGRMNRRRLEAEEIRDSLLSASGTLDPQMGGVAFREMNLPRRTVYLMTIRSDRTGFGTLFDTADSNSSSEKRGVSTVAPQALFLLNNPFILSQAQKLSKRLIAENTVDLQRIQSAYLILYGRPATPAEIQIGQAFLKGEEHSPSSKWEAYCQILLCANEFLYVD